MTLDTAALLVLGPNATDTARVPIYDASGVVVRPSSDAKKRNRREISDAPPGLELIAEKCSEESFQCLIRAATFAHMKAVDFDTKFKSQDGTFEATLRKESTSCRQVYAQCLATKEDTESQ